MKPAVAAGREMKMKIQWFQIMTDSTETLSTRLSVAGSHPYDDDVSHDLVEEVSDDDLRDAELCAYGDGLIVGTPDSGWATDIRLGEIQVPSTMSCQVFSPDGDEHVECYPTGLMCGSYPVWAADGFIAGEIAGSTREDGVYIPSVLTPLGGIDADGKAYTGSWPNYEDASMADAQLFREAVLMVADRSIAPVDHRNVLAPGIGYVGEESTGKIYWSTAIFDDVDGTPTLTDEDQVVVAYDGDIRWVAHEGGWFREGEFVDPTA